MSSSRKYWFPSKKYGWGWGVPATWQGWLVLSLYFGAIALLAWLYESNDRLLPFFAGLAAATAAFVMVAWAKGEPPRWRWGSSEGADIRGDTENQ